MTLNMIPVSRLILFSTLLVKSHGLALPLRMMSTNNYLKSLDKTCQNDENSIRNIISSKTGTGKTEIVNRLLQVSKPTDKDEVEIDTILVNIRRIGCINFNLNSPFILMKLGKTMDNVFYITKEGNVEKLNKTTKLISGKIRNFSAYDFDSECLMDCIVFNSEM